MNDPKASVPATPNDGENADATAHETAPEPDRAEGSPAEAPGPSHAPVWEQPYSQPHSQPAPQYGQPNPQYGQPAPQYGQPNPQYGQPAPQYGQPDPQYGQPYAQQYPPTYGQPYAAGPATNTLAIIALIAAFVFPPAGIVCGHIALGQIKTTGEAGRGLALAGVIIGYVWAALIILIIVTSFVLPLVVMGIFAPAFVGLGTM